MASLQIFSCRLDHFINRDSFHGFAAVHTWLDIAAGLRAAGKTYLRFVSHNFRRYESAEQNNGRNVNRRRRVMHSAFRSYVKPSAR